MISASPSTVSSLWRSLLSPVFRHKKQLLLTLISGILAQGAAFACVVLTGLLCLLVLDALPWSTLLVCAVWLAASVLLTGLARWALAWLSHDLAFALIETLQMGIFNGVARGAPVLHDSQRTGDIAASATRDASLMERFYAHMLVDYLTAFILPCIALVMLLLINPWLGAVFLPCVMLITAAPALTSRQAKRRTQDVATSKSVLDNLIAELCQGWRDIQMSGAHKRYTGRLQAANTQLNAAQRRADALTGLASALLDSLMALSLISVTGVSLFLMDRNLLSPHQLPFIISIAAAALIPLLDALYVGGQWGALKASAERILTLQNLPEHVEDVPCAGVPAHHVIRFDRVNFSYQRGEEAVLKDVSFMIPEGEHVAIAGPSGSGKTTIACLLMRFYNPQSGCISLGGQPLPTMSIKSLRHQIAWVSQESWLFSDTLENNIRLGCPDATSSQVENAAKLAQADSFIRALPDGYQTMCSGGGDNFSGGQRQRIALARALVSAAPVIVLDETSAGLDDDNEQRILRALKALPTPRTVIMIAHRISMLKAADRVLLLENGRITETGQHNELINQQGSYAKLIDAIARDN